MFQFSSHTTITEIVAVDPRACTQYVVRWMAARQDPVGQPGTPVFREVRFLSLASASQFVRELHAGEATHTTAGVRAYR